MTRRDFIKNAAASAATCLLGCSTVREAGKGTGRGGVATGGEISLPEGTSPAPLALPHFPDRLHAFVWRNWPLVPVARLAAVVGAAQADILSLGRAMGLPEPPRPSRDQQRRSSLTIIKRNWHLLPYNQLLKLLDWTPERLADALHEDDFLFVKLGSLKPKCEPLKYSPPDEAARKRAQHISFVVREAFPHGLFPAGEALFEFVRDLSRPPMPSAASSRGGGTARLTPRFCSSYFALYGDPLLEPAADPYPDGYLARLAESGVDGVWLQAVLYKLAPFPWDARRSAQHEQRVKNLRALVTRARKHGIGVFLYLNEPRSMPLSFFQPRPDLKGVTEGEHATLCTSDPAVQNYLVDSVASICRRVPDLAGFFTITGSENLTHCWSHGGGSKCPRCGRRPAGEVVAEVNRLIFEGMRKAASQAQLLVWDWGWADAWAEDIIKRLPATVSVMSVSEWSLPIERGGVRSAVGEYSISAIGPGPRALRHWEFARQRGLKTIAKIQAGNTWELSAVPYIPAVANVARHAANLRAANVDGLMLGWTLGGYPSPNLEVVAEMAGGEDGLRLSADEAMQRVAERRFGKGIAPAVVTAWREFSRAFSEFPFHAGLVYSAPLQVGPSNLLADAPTGYRATMVGFPYDDLDAWRAVYPPGVFIDQLEKVAGGFERAVQALTAATAGMKHRRNEQRALAQELNVAEAASIHFRSAANQARFILARRLLLAAKRADEAGPQITTLEMVLQDEIALACRLHAIQSRDSRIGFEASNQYYYVPLDLAEKVVSCRDLRDRWLGAQRVKWST